MSAAVTNLAVERMIRRLPKAKRLEARRLLEQLNLAHAKVLGIAYDDTAGVIVRYEGR